MPTKVRGHSAGHENSAAPIRCGLAVSLRAQTGQSEAIHSREACATTVVRLTMPRSLRRSKLTAPDFDRLARTPWPICLFGGLTESTRSVPATTHGLCCSCDMYWAAAASFENDQGGMNRLRHRVAARHPAVGVAAIHFRAGETPAA